MTHLPHTDATIVMRDDGTTFMRRVHATTWTGLEMDWQQHAGPLLRSLPRLEKILDGMPVEGNDWDMRAEEIHKAIQRLEALLTISMRISTTETGGSATALARRLGVATSTITRRVNNYDPERDTDQNGGSPASVSQSK